MLMGVLELGLKSNFVFCFFSVMKSLNCCTQTSWEIEKLNSDLKVHSLEQDLENLKQECNSLRKELQKYKQKVLPFLNIFCMNSFDFITALL